MFFINMKQRLLSISVNTQYRVIFACLYWKSQGKVREFHVAWKVVTLHLSSLHFNKEDSFSLQVKKIVKVSFSR